MAIHVEPNKSLDTHQELIQLVNQGKREAVLKSLLALAALIAGVAVILFLGPNFLPIGIGLVLVSGLAIYQYLNCCRYDSKIFAEAAKAIRAHL